MSDPAVLSAIAQHMAAIPDLPRIVWGNEAFPANAPFIVWDDGPQNGTPETLDGDEVFEFRPQVSVMIDSGEFTTEIDAIMWKVAQAFKFGTQIADADGAYVAYCLQTPTANNGGRSDGAYFRRDMTLRIASHQQI